MMNDEDSQALKCPHCGRSIIVQVVPARPAPYEPGLGTTSAPASIEAALEKWRDSLVLSEKDDSIIVFPKEFLGRETWVGVNEALSQFGAQWVSAGKNSRWIIPK